MRQRERPPRDPEFARDPRRDAVQRDGRPTARLAHNLGVGPRDAPRPSCSQAFQDRLFGREPRRIVLDTPLARVRVGALAGGEAAFEEPRAVPVDHRPDPGDLRRVDAVPDDRHAYFFAPAFAGPAFAGPFSPEPPFPEPLFEDVLFDFESELSELLSAFVSVLESDFVSPSPLWAFLSASAFWA